MLESGLNFNLLIINADEPAQEPVPEKTPEIDITPKAGDVEREYSTTVLPKPKSKRPNLYRVLLLNDDYTPMEFVILVLEGIFHKSRDAATQVMLHVHNHGVGECGIFTYEVAETKVSQVLDLARKNSHPLQCVMEKKDA